jgi:hypothetical protein
MKPELGSIFVRRSAAGGCRKPKDSVRITAASKACIQRARQAVSERCARRGFLSRRRHDLPAQRRPGHRFVRAAYAHILRGSRDTIWSRLASNMAPRLPLCLALLLILLSGAPEAAFARGGTDLHEPLPVVHAATLPGSTLHLPAENFKGCGHGRYRDPRTHKCRGPADFGN